ncbi:MAG: tRNA-dihydrouridine synthase C [Syntrophorhabdus sp. PtaU1.Bin002]|nr:MAG: tRNA-dihydrouridine synthase C [Syntrophorhabdus sp. PtaU1.Bin002]
MLAIATLVLPLPCVLAPMSGISDLPFRLITRSFGAPLAFTEMIDVRAIHHKDKRTRHMLASTPEDRPLGVQILGNDGESLIKALDALEEWDFELLDFNAACPTPKVTRKGKGAALLKEPHILKKLLGLLVERSKVPVTVKIRAGWDHNSINAREVALIAEDAGVSGIFIHGRTKAQGYSGTVDYRIIREAKKAVKVPVIASGDNASVCAVKKMFEETGCDGVVIARGSLGNPWIFREAVRFFQDGGVCSKPDPYERSMIMKRHLGLSVQHYGEKKGVGNFHKFFIWYTKGLSGIKPFRDRAFRANTLGELLALIDELHTLEHSVPEPEASYS